MLSKKRKTLTLVELMMASMILIIVVLALAGVYISSLHLTIQAKETNIAVDDVKDVIEKIKNVNFPDIPTVFPDGVSVPESMVGGYLLDNENIVVRYPNGTDVDPLEIEVEITWDGKDKRNYAYIFKTIRTRNL